MNLTPFVFEPPCNSRYVFNLFQQYVFNQNTNLSFSFIIKNTQNEYGQIVNYLLAARRNDVTKLMQAFLEDFDLNSQGLIVINYYKDWTDFI